MSADELTYESAITGDVAWLTDTYIAALGEAIKQARGEWNETRERALFLSQLRLADTLVICRRNERVGFYAASHEPDHLFLQALCILPRYQNSGYGEEVMRALARRSAKLPIRVQALKSSPPARRFYERLGYRWISDSEYHHLLEWTRGPVRAGK